MIDAREFLEELKGAGIAFFSGVPDSLLKEFCLVAYESLLSKEHVIATNEGSAVGLAIGQYVATGKLPLVYLQNSGLGNLINPLISLADPLIFRIPMVLLVGWRGELDENNIQLPDEPQHEKQGQVTLKMLDSIGVPYSVLSGSTIQAGAVVRHAVVEAINRSGPIAIVVRRGTFSPITRSTPPMGAATKIKREVAIAAIASVTPRTIPIVCTTGMASRELFEVRECQGGRHEQDFLVVGGMGHASSIATGVAMAYPNRKVLCIDGDGALLMHTGSLALSASCENLIHIVINNGAHDSVGGQPTKALSINLPNLASSFGYDYSDCAVDVDELKTKLKDLFGFKGSVFLEIQVATGARKDLSRPTLSPRENALQFMQFLSNLT